MITVNILTKNNQNTIKKCLDSIKFDCNILIGDYGSTDQTLSLCPYKIVKLEYKENYSDLRNELALHSSTDLQLFIDPWEHVVSGEPNGYKVYNVQGDVVTKQSRIWNKHTNKFINPVYETLEIVENSLSSLVITGTAPNKFKETINILNKWKLNNPHNYEIDYYTALTYLVNGWCDEFLRNAEHFMFKTTEMTTSRLLIHYYYAIVQLLHKKNHKKCIEHITHCLVQKPTLAEFWCLLGDSLYKMKQWHRAIAFYENAISMGSKRMEDDLPIEVSKYKEYPESMIKTIKEILQ